MTLHDNIRQTGDRALVASRRMVRLVRELLLDLLVRGPASESLALFRSGALLPVSHVIPAAHEGPDQDQDNDEENDDQYYIHVLI